MNALRLLVLFSFCVFSSLFFSSCHHGDKSSNISIDNCNGNCFPNGVAAGDVDQTSVMLWARAIFTGTVQFEYVIDDDPDTDEVPDFQQPDGVEEKEVETVMDADGNITDYIPTKVELTGLLPGTKYYYRACRDSCSSDIAPESEAGGKFKTPYADGKHGLKFGVSSCFRGDLKPFVSISNVPESDLDFFVSLGDTTYADDRKVLGFRAITKPQFRLKYIDSFSEMNSSKNNYFANLRSSTAFFATIDDHEVVNDFAGGADPRSQIDSCECSGTEVLDSSCPRNLCFCNDNLDDPLDDDPLDDGMDAVNCELPYINQTALFNNALDAWHEYNPVRKERYGLTGDDRTKHRTKLYRYRTFGKDAAMFMLDARSFRDEASRKFTNNADRTMLGKAQLDELLNNLRDAENRGITWKFILVPEPIQHVGIIGAPDRFEGYDYERNIILDMIQTECIDNVVFVSGDIHYSVANNLTYEKPRINTLGRQRYSTAWDISTGPGAYSPTIPAGLTMHMAGQPSQAFEDFFSDLVNTQLKILNRPATGFGDDDFTIEPLQSENVPIPANISKGRFDLVNGFSYGWTEFEINAEQFLTVTTYGIPWYEPGTVSTEKPSIISQFEVTPVFPAKDGEACEVDNDCFSCRCSILPRIIGGENQCLANLPNGSGCAFDGQCASGRCAGIPPTCQSKLPNGSLCVFDVDCNSGRCVGVPPLAECRRKLQTGESCTFNVDCISNSCSGRLIRNCD